MIVLQCLFSPASERLEQRDRSSASSTMLLINKQLRVGSHWHASESKSAYWLARVTLYCKQYYVTLMTHYTHHNNDVIIDVKTFWHPVLFSCRKDKNCSYFKVTWTRIQNPYYCEWLLSEYMQTRTCISVNPAWLGKMKESTRAYNLVHSFWLKVHVTDCLHLFPLFLKNHQNEYKKPRRVARIRHRY